MMKLMRRKFSQSILGLVSVLVLFGASAAANGANKSLGDTQGPVYVENNINYALDGDFASNSFLKEIPVPGSLLLFGAGFVGLLVVAPRKSRKTNAV